jgi:hypothetical protein
MDDHNERRGEQRLGYPWPVWFSTDFTETQFQGLMIDVSSGGMQFSCKADLSGLREGQHLTVRFGIPRFEADDPTATVNITRGGLICRIEGGGDSLCRVGLEFDVPLPLRPSEVSTLRSCCGGDFHP